ncbi:MAG: hypothetical protein DMG49_14305 [Acidobacteria bacterium]|nr:MAG: hypothetical protein DMG49_14305 [Acidobacteriota bacterium]
MRLSRLPSVLIPVPACLFFCLGALFGQTPNATVTGLVSDPSGAAVSDAVLVFTNLNTNASYSAKTNGDGFYRLTSLLPGTYRANLTKEGFKSVVKDDIQLHVQDEVALNFVLQVGSVSESVTVQAGEPLLETQSTSLSQVVEGRQVQDMPLNGRNTFNLLGLVPGVVPQGSTRGNPMSNQLGGSFTNVWGFGNYQIGGSIANQNASYFDGAPLNVPENNAILIVPTQDAVQEFRVATNNVSAEFGGFAGGVVNMTTKSGTNAFHGSAYEYFRNTVLDANNYFSNAAGIARAQLNQNQYGVSFSGPIVKDKAFFFFGWEGFALRKGIPNSLTVPTAAMLNGDFSAICQTGFTNGICNDPNHQIYDPCGGTVVGGAGCPGYSGSRTPFLNNLIPSTRIDPSATVLAKLWAAPNRPGLANNFVNNTSVGGNENQYNARVDYNVNDKQRIFGRYTYWHFRNLGADPFATKTGTPVSVSTNQQFVVGSTYALSSNTILDVRASYLHMNYNVVPLNFGTDMSRFGPNWAALSPQLTFHEYPIPNIAGYTPFQIVIMDVTQHNGNADYSLSASTTKIFSRHTFKFGGELRRQKYTFISLVFPNDLYEFDSGFTAASNGGAGGYSFASFLLGYSSSGTLSTAARVDQLLNPQGYYLSDTFQATRKLTLNLGIRWDQPGQFFEKNDRDTVFLANGAPQAGGITSITNPVSNQSIQLHGQLALVNTPAWSDRHDIARRWNLFSPRVGFAYQATTKTVVRAGYGINRLPASVAANGPNVSPLNTAVTAFSASSNGGVTPASTLSNPFPNGSGGQSVIQPAGRSTQFLASLVGQAVASQLPREPSAYVQQWNLNVQRELPFGGLFEIGYAGSKGTHLPISIPNTSVTIDQLPDQYTSLGNALLTPVTNPFASVNGGPVTSGPLSFAQIPQGLLLKRYSQYASVGSPELYRADSSYNALTTRFEKRFEGGGTILASYTWSRLFSNTDVLTGYLEDGPVGAIQDYNNFSGERSLISYDVPHRFVVSYVYDLPIGKGRKFLASSDGTVNHIASGWAINGITTFQSGTPLVITAQPNVLSTTFGAGTIRPDVIPGCHKSISGSRSAKINEWFNINCFSQPGQFNFGTERRTDPTLRTDGIKTFDFAVTKSTPITERVSLLFDTEFLNLFNRVQFAAPNTNFNSSTIGTTANVFGKAFSQQNQPRLIQFALRLRF